MFQLVMLKNVECSVYLEPKRKVGDVVWVRNRVVAQHLIDSGLCRWNEVRPAVARTVEPAEKKSFGDLTDGPSTDSPSSTASGPEQPSSSSAEVLVAPERI